MKKTSFLKVIFLLMFFEDFPDFFLLGLVFQKVFFIHNYLKCL
jgi:hypothetical protein